jgi:hypothetical protein
VAVVGLEPTLNRLREGGNRGIRTLTERALNPLPLPLGYIPISCEPDRHIALNNTDPSYPALIDFLCTA